MSIYPNCIEVVTRQWKAITYCKIAFFVSKASKYTILPESANKINLFPCQAVSVNSPIVEICYGLKRYLKMWSTFFEWKL